MLFVLPMYEYLFLMHIEEEWKTECTAGADEEEKRKRKGQ